MRSVFGAGVATPGAPDSDEAFKGEVREAAEDGPDEDAVADDDDTVEPVAAQQQRAEKISMQALTRRGQSRWEIEKALLGRDIDSGIVEAELDRLERVGLIDDAALAETLVRTRHERKGLGRSALTAELRRRHVDQQHIDAALEQIDDDDEQSRATELAVRRAPQMRSLDGETAKRRLTGFLMRKGYSGSVVRTAVDEALRTLGPRTSGVRFR
jgi:regulatory protein